MKPYWLVPLALAADQGTKFLVQHTMVRGHSVPVLGDFFRLTYIHNSGAAFGLNLGNPWAHTAVSLVALAALGWLLRSAPRDDRLMRFSLWLVLGGAVGNIVDRVYLGEVVDFLDFGLGGLRWPVFNLADTFVTVGIGLLALAYSRHKGPDPATERLEGRPSP